MRVTGPFVPCAAVVIGETTVRKFKVREVEREDRGELRLAKKGNRKRQNYENVKKYYVHDQKTVDGTRTRVKGAGNGSSDLPSIPHPPTPKRLS